MKDKKEVKGIVKNVIRFIILIILMFLVVSIYIVISIFTEGESKGKMEKYETKAVRMEYYEKNKQYFNYFVNLFEQPVEIVLIDYKSNFNSCSNGEVESYLLNRIHVCSLNPLNLTDEEEKEIVTNFENMEDIYSIQTRTDEEEKKAAISFYLVLALNGRIHYNYCLSFDTCDSEDDYYINDRGKFEKNKIDDYWSSIYDTLYTI